MSEAGPQPTGAAMPPALLSRALAAFSVQALCAAAQEEAAASVTDGFDDGGLDAVYYNTKSKELLLCQAKWIASGHGSPSQADIQKFIAGVKCIINLRLETLNAKIRAMESVIRTAVLDASTKIRLVVAYSGIDKLGIHPQRELDAYIAGENSIDATFSLDVLDQARLYQLIIGGISGQAISFDVHMCSWGFMDGPNPAYYGTVAAQDIATWWRSHGRQLLFRNIREFKGTTEVNDAMKMTLQCEPHNFWYFNNGITLLCDRVVKKPFGGSERMIGIFECTNVSVVNGAQTVGQIGSLADEGHSLGGANILVRLISLENTPAGFDARITRATNTQNRIEGLDFASLDSVQRRLASELRLDNVRYAYKTGEPTPDSSGGFTLTDATIALACSQSDSGLSVQVKNQIGRIFDDLSTVPYTALFNEDTNARQLWSRVRVMRVVDEELAKLQSAGSPRASLVAVHGNRFILHRVFQQPAVKSFICRADIGDAIPTSIAHATAESFEELSTYVNAEYSDSYLAPLFKNRQKVREIVESLSKGSNRSNSSVASDTGSLFGPA